MNRAKKAENVEELKEKFANASAVFLSDYRGLTVAQMTSLRFELKKVNSDFRIVKNRLALRALKDELRKDLEPHFDDMTAVAIATGDVATSAKALTQFAKENEKLKLRAGILEGKVISLNEIKALSTLPSRQELLAKLLATWNAVPSGFVRVLNAVPTGWVNVLDALKRKNESGGEA